MDKIKRFIECLVPVTACNLKCDYCYVIQEGRRKNEIPKFQYSPEHIGNALNKQRLGGICYISICGAGETLIPKEMPNIIKEILKSLISSNKFSSNILEIKSEVIFSLA